MALVDLKSKLNEFGENNPNNPYKKGEKKTDLQSKVDVDNEKYLEIGEQPESDLTKLNSRYDRENTPDSAIVREKTKKSSAKEFIKDFGLSSFDVPTSDNYEDNIKKENIDGFSDVTRGVKEFEKTIKGVKDLFKGKVSKGIKGITDAEQESKLSAYRAKAYGKIKRLGEQGRKVSNVDFRVSDEYEGPIKGGNRSKNVNRANIQSTEDDTGKDRDLIPFRFTAINPKGANEYITFSAILSGITDTITPEYSTDRFVGRPDNVYVYQGVTRAISFTFDVYPTTRQEMKPLWEKINRVVGLCYPNWTPAPAPLYDKKLGYEAETMISPMCNLTIGDLYNETPGFLGGVTVQVQDGTTWEYEENLELPHHIQIACEFIYVGKHKPTAGEFGKHFELNWLPTPPPPGAAKEPESPTWKMKTKDERKAKREANRDLRSQGRWNRANGFEDDGSGFATSIDSEV
jgi:hypothetical protein